MTRLYPGCDDDGPVCTEGCDPGQCGCPGSDDLFVGKAESWSDATRHERKRLEITIGQCADLLGCSASHYSALELGRARPTDSEKSQLAWYFRRYAEVRAADKRVEDR